ncbi:MAG: YibE/F family protein [Candidatus Gottesmanbacteria bacterium]
MKKVFLIIYIFLTIFLSPVKILADDSQTPQDQYYKAQVISVDKQGEKDVYGTKSYFQDIRLIFLDGPDQGKTINYENGGQFSITKDQTVSPGETVIMSKTTGPDGKSIYFVVEKYRLDYLPYLLILFVFLIFIIAGKKGLGSLLGLVISLAVISMWIVPQILQNGDPLTTCIIGSLAILLVTTYLAHGISRQTTIALLSTFVSLMVTALLSIIVVHITKLTGLSNEDVYSLQFGSTKNINTQGLLLGGIIIGTLGALNDVTTTQAATIFEIFKDNPLIKFENLYKKGLLIGREHIVSLVNTLVLAYAGASLAVMIFFVLNPNKEPLWVIVNSEAIYDEIVRTVVGSMGLILAIPLVTLLATWYVTNRRNTVK